MLLCESLSNRIVTEILRVNISLRARNAYHANGVKRPEESESVYTFQPI